MSDRLAFVCPVCRRMSHNRTDAEQGYCGACHAWTAFLKGDRVSVEYDGRKYDAEVVIASPNGRSLMLAFDCGVWAPGGVFLGLMPVLQDDDGRYRDLLEGCEAVITRANRAPN